jgi:hypothetical protein
MANTPTVDQAVERAQRAQEKKIEVVRVLASARQSLVDARAAAAERLAAVERDNAEQVGEAEREDVLSFQAAVKAGWTRDELRKIGFDEPAKVRRARRKKAGSAPTSSAASVTDASDGVGDTGGQPAAG